MTNGNPEISPGAERRMVQAWLVCPMCKGELIFTRPRIVCASCGCVFDQPSEEWINLLPHRFSADAGDDWATRLGAMEDWYRGNIDDAHDFLAHDFAPLAPSLRALSGDVLDIGGGVGLARQFLPTGCRYAVLDPSAVWLDGEWRTLAGRFPALASPPPFIRGVGEFLPFRPATFDAVLSFWSLNHASDPASIFREAHRVLRPHGRFLVVLEDMRPSSRDVLMPAFYRGYMRLVRWHLRQDRGAALGRDLIRGRGWPLQIDHIRIRDADLREWCGGRFRVRRRQWQDHHLVLELERA